MASARPAKKTGTIEVRLSDDAKAAFMDRCRQEQKTASEMIRDFIDARIAARPVVRRAPLAAWRTALAGIVGIAVGIGVAAPSLARATHDTRPAFDRLDCNHDGVLSYREFAAR